MRKVLGPILGCGLLAGLGACSHAVDVTPLDGGEPGRGGTRFLSRDGPLAINLDGKVYRGAWGQALDAPPPELVPARSVHVGRFYGQRRAAGPGWAELRAEDGSVLTCRFSYVRGQGQGSGLCRSDQGRSFSMTIR
jgi:hypothetical protein